MWYRNSACRSNVLNFTCQNVFQPNRWNIRVPDHSQVRNLSSGIEVADLSSQRGLVMLYGRDATKFLQGLTTNHINESGSDNLGHYNAFLSPQV